MKKKRLLLLFVFILVIIILCSVCFLNFRKNKTVVKDVKEEKEKVVEEKKLKILDLDSNSRSIAVMINNISTVWGYQSGLNDAYLVYEMLVEGGYTRLMALFKDKQLSRIGTVRSSRHYFLDYALENDAIYVHFGWSPQAQSDINLLNVDNINFMTYNGYIRDTSLGLSKEHTVFTNTDDILNGASKYNYSKTTEKEPLLNYSLEEIDLSKNENAVVANNVTINFSNNHITSFVYNSDNKVYERYQNNASHTDYVNKSIYTAKNIIVYKVAYTVIPGDNKGRLDINNITSGEGYYISNGYAIPITFEKSSRTGETIYKNKNGEEIKVNDGNTYIEIAPTGRQVLLN